MRGLKYLLFVLLILAAIAIPLGMSFRPAAGGSIEGLIIDQSGAPVARATVQAYHLTQGRTSATVSEANGFYRIASLAGGRYSLWAEAKGYASQWIPMVIVEEGQATKRDIQLKRDIPTEEARSTAVQ